jgi:hypothetical protein
MFPSKPTDPWWSSRYFGDRTSNDPANCQRSSSQPCYPAEVVIVLWFPAPLVVAEGGEKKRGFAVVDNDHPSPVHRVLVPRPTRAGDGTRWTVLVPVHSAPPSQHMATAPPLVAVPESAAV